MPASKGKAEACWRIDVRDWASRGKLETGYAGSVKWQDSVTGKPTGAIRYRIESDTAVLTYTFNGLACVQRVPLISTPCHFGGERTWFACPDCAARVALLQMQYGGFNCRKCAQVAYRSQSEDAVARSWRAQLKAEAKLSKDRARPKGMHATTYERLLQTIRRCEEVRGQAMARIVSTRYAAWR